MNTTVKQNIENYTLLDALPCALLVMGSNLELLTFNAGAQEFFGDICILFEGMDCDMLSGFLWDMADDDDSGEVNLLCEQMHAGEECTIDYRKFDGRHYRICARPYSGGAGSFPNESTNCQFILHITDISDIVDAEQLMAKRSTELARQSEELLSRLKLVDAIVSEREATRLRAEFYVRMTRLLDRFEDALESGDIDTCRAEIKRQREYAAPASDDGRREEFVFRLKKSVNPTGLDGAMPSVVFHHIAYPKCMDLLENDIIEAVRESVMLIAMCGIANVIYISLRPFEEGVELGVHCDEPVISDFESAEPYLRLKGIAKRMHAKLKTSTAMGFDLRVQCAFSAKEAAVKRYKLSTIEQDIIAMIGSGMSSSKVAERIHYSQGSLRNMLSAIYEKLGISDKAQLTAFAILNGFADSFEG